MSEADPGIVDQAATAESPAGDAGARHRVAGPARPARAAANGKSIGIAATPAEDDITSSLEYWYFCGGGRDLRDT